MSVNAVPIHKMQQLEMVSRPHSLQQVVWKGDLNGGHARLLWPTPHASQLHFSTCLGKSSSTAPVSLSSCKETFKREIRGINYTPRCCSWFQLELVFTVSPLPLNSPHPQLISVVPGGLSDGMTQTFIPEGTDSVEIIPSQANIATHVHSPF